MHQRTIIHIAPTPFFSDRGCHIRIRNEAQALQSNDLRVIICTYHLGRDITGLDIRRTCRIPGYTKLDAGFSPYRIVADFLLFWLVLRVALSERADLLHCHLHEGVVIGWAVRILLFWRRIPIVMDKQGSLVGELVSYGTIGKKSLISRIIRAIEFVIYRMPAKIFCSSRHSKDIARHEFGVDSEQLEILVDIVPDSFFKKTDPEPLKRRLKIRDDHTVIIYTGSLLPGKGIDILLDAFRIAAGTDPNLLFIVVGYPVDDAQAYISRYGLEDRILLSGQTPYRDLGSWLSLADVAVEPKTEGSGEASGKTLHYMAAGLPVVCFDTVTNRSLLGEHGFYSEQATAEGLARALSHAVHDHAGRHDKGQAGHQLIKARFSSAAIRSQLNKAYRHLASI